MNKVHPTPCQSQYEWDAAMDIPDDQPDERCTSCGFECRWDAAYSNKGVCPCCDNHLAVDK